MCESGNRRPCRSVGTSTFKRTASRLVLICSVQQAICLHAYNVPEYPCPSQAQDSPPRKRRSDEPVETNIESWKRQTDATIEIVPLLTKRARLTRTNSQLPRIKDEEAEQAVKVWQRSLIQSTTNGEVRAVCTTAKVSPSQASIYLVPRRLRRPTLIESCSKKIPS